MKKLTLTLLKDLPGFPAGLTRKIAVDYKRVQFHSGRGDRMVFYRKQVESCPDFFKVDD